MAGQAKALAERRIKTPHPPARDGVYIKEHNIEETKLLIGVVSSFPKMPVDYSLSDFVK